LSGSGEVLRVNTEATSLTDTFSLHVQTSDSSPQSFESKKFQVEASELLGYDSAKKTEDIAISLRKSTFD